MFAEYIGEILRFSAAEDMTWTSLGESCWIGLGIWNLEDPRSHARHQHQKLLIRGWVVTHSGIGSPNPQDSSIFTPQQSHPPDMKHSHSMVQTLVSGGRVIIRGMGVPSSVQVPFMSHWGEPWEPTAMVVKTDFLPRRLEARLLDVNGGVEQDIDMIHSDDLWCMVHWDMYLCYYTMSYLFMCVHV